MQYSSYKRNASCMSRCRFSAAGIRFILLQRCTYVHLALWRDTYYDPAEDNRDYECVLIRSVKACQKYIFATRCMKSLRAMVPIAFIVSSGMLPFYSVPVFHNSLRYANDAGVFNVLYFWKIKRDFRCNLGRDLPSRVQRGLAGFYVYRGQNLNWILAVYGGVDKEST